ncbi:hypothetical protein L7F22_058468 [Adiantum nelumboides]|nr:hypothetical protein [Adiantum nelumboides]
MFLLGHLLSYKEKSYGLYLLGDSAYKARTLLVKPFRVNTGPFAREKREFDKNLSEGRIKVENAFGFLKTKWWILQDVNVDLALAFTIVGACCMLHNFVQLRGEAEPSDQRDPHLNHDDPIARDSEESVAQRDGLTCERFGSKSATLWCILWDGLENVLLQPTVYVAG